MSENEPRNNRTVNYIKNSTTYSKNTLQGRSLGILGHSTGALAGRVIEEVVAESESVCSTTETEASIERCFVLQDTADHQGPEFDNDHKPRSIKEVPPEHNPEDEPYDSRDQSQFLLEGPLAMATLQDSQPEEKNQADSFETVEFGSKGPPNYKQQADAGFFHCGRLIGVPSDHHNMALRGRTLVVLTVSNHGWAQCACLCQHEELNGRESRAFYRAHVAVYSEDRPKDFIRTEHSPVHVKMLSGYKIKADCFVNFEHTFCLNNRGFKIASIGTVDEKEKLIEMYRKVQGWMYDLQVKRIEDGED